jgi:3-hydroxyisobutyrate dehydrogenase
MSNRSVAFLGTGLLGSAMVRRLLAAGFEVTVWNRHADKLAALVAAGAVPAQTPAAAAAGHEIVCLCLTNPDAVEAVVLGDRGISQTPKSDSQPRVLVDFSTIGPHATLTLATRLRSASGMSWVDAPVSGGVAGAETGQLVIFCGGDSRDVERVQPVFAPLAQRVTRIGALGAGQTLKLCNQLIVASALVAIAEAMALGKAAGLEVGELPDLLAGGFADSTLLQTLGRRMAKGQTSPKTGELATMLKDIDAVVNLAKERGVSAPLAARAAEVYRLACTRGLSHEDLAALPQVYGD